MSGRPGPRRCVAVFAGIGLDERDEVLDGVRRHRRMDRDHQGGGDRERDQVEVLFEFIGDFVVERGIDHVARIDHEQGVAIGRHPCHSAHGDIAAAAAHVLDVELLAHTLRQLLREQAGDHIGRTAGRVGNDHAHGSVGIALRPRYAREGLGERQQQLPNAKIDGAQTFMASLAELLTSRQSAASDMRNARAVGTPQ